jgi:hypothetical protein
MRALEFMAKHGIQGMVGGGSAEGGAMHKVVLDWQAAHATLGKPIGRSARAAQNCRSRWCGCCAGPDRIGQVRSLSENHQD